MGTGRTWLRSNGSFIATLMVSAACTSCGSTSRTSLAADGGAGSAASGAASSSLNAGAGSGAGGGSGQPTTSGGTSTGGDAASTPAADAAITDAGATAEGGASPSSGCGGTSWPTASPQTINVTDKANNTIVRQFYFGLPAAYSPAHPYPLVFAWHYAGGEASTIAGTGFTGNYYGIQPNLPNAIYVAPQGMQGPPMADGAPGVTGWPNTDDQDIAFARAMVSWFETNFCIDQSRLMSTGFSYGGIMSHTIACEMPDVFRAIGVMSGALIEPASNCVNHDIAAWITHGDADTTLPYADGVSALDRIVALDHCGSTTSPVAPSPCVQYASCDTGEPVIWCPVGGEGHAIPTFAASAIATFFAQF